MDQPTPRILFRATCLAILAVLILQGRFFAQGTPSYFQETARFPFLNGVSSGLTSATTADLDANGVADLIIEDYGNPQFWIALNPGTSGYSNPVNYNLSSLGTFTAATAGITSRLRVAHADGDTIPDIIVPLASLTQDVFVLRGQGNGSFQMPPISQVPVSGVGYLWSDDLTSDGIADVVVLRVNPPPLSFPSGHFTWDVVVLINNNPGWTLTWTMSYAMSPIPDVVIGDFDGDGSKDLAWNFGPNLMSAPVPPNSLFFVAWGQGNGGFGTPSVFSFNFVPPVAASTDHARALIAADLNHDGCSDIIPLFYASTGEFTRVHFGSPARTFSHGKPVPITPIWTTGTVGQLLVDDFDGDGQEDIVVRRDYPLAGSGGGFDIEHFRGTSGGGFVSPPMVYPVRNLPGQYLFLPCVLVPVDLDADGDLDLFGGPGYVNAFVFTNAAISAPGCVLPGFGEPGIGVTGLRPGSIATVGLSGAPPILGCGLAIGTGLGSGPFPVCGIAVDPMSPYVLLPATTDSSGFSSLSVQIPSAPGWVGSTWFLQWIVPSLGPVPAVSACMKAVVW